MKIKFGLLVLILPIFLLFLVFIPKGENRPKNATRIKGVNLVAPDTPFGQEAMNPIKEIGIEWVAIIPYAYSRQKDPVLHWDEPWQWWGEKYEGTKESIIIAKNSGLSVMLKPHVWVVDQGWAGDYNLTLEEEWIIWEKHYRKYILLYAGLADSLDVEMFCIGTEYRYAVNKRPEFWRNLIKETRELYGGKVTYAANWDNYRNINFWNHLDYIGIDAYWPLSEERTPSKMKLLNEWMPIKTELEDFSLQWDLPIIFTEYGFRSSPYTANEPWNTSGKANKVVDLKGQEIAYEAFYESFNDIPWYAGGFLWKWHPDHQSSGGPDCSRFTPQNKPAQDVVSRWNSK
jgi:hypothetical protein